MLSSASFICFVICITHFPTVHSQTCSNGLTSPPDLIWTPSPTSPDIYTATLTFDVSTKTWNNNAISLTTRLYNDLLGGPSMRMQRGKQYQLTFINNLGPERIENEALSGNQERDPNTTNVHTHGVHISPLDPADYVFVPVLPGGNITYIYNIPCTHAGGVHWYHAHHHPSVQLQVGGGAAGAIIIEDDPIEEGLPDWYNNMRELIFFINHIDVTFINIGYPERTQAQIENQFILKLTPNNQDLYIVNGQYQPTVCQTLGEWIKYRFVQTEIRDPQRYQIGNIGDCILKLLARDGNIIQNPPRDVGNIVWLSEASRADVAITCIGGIHSITALTDNGNMVIGYIHVTGVDIFPTQVALDLTPFQPIRPYYLRDLRNAIVDNSLSMTMWHNGIVINNGARQIFGELANPYFDGVDNIGINTINEWTLHAQPLGFNTGLYHPMHIHINHFQIITGPNGENPVGWQTHLVAPPGYQQVGDFVDTIWGPGTIRFPTDIWGGPMLVHCHRLEHEVGGSMGSMFIENGCDASYNHFNTVGTCNFNVDCSPTSAPTANPSTQPTIVTNTPTSTPTRSTFNPSSSPTQEPTIHPTDLPSEIPTDMPTNEPSVSPTNIPTIEPTYEPSIEPTYNPTKYPSTHPTIYPTINPSTHPTIYPTINPSTHPTIYPTINPSNNPTNIPSLYPTVNPSNKPSITPTKYPSALPTYNPTIEPTILPTLYPSIDPSRTPSKNPSLLPTLYPSMHPTMPPTPMSLTCDEKITGSYDNKILYFKIELPYDANLMFDASESDFDIKTLTASATHTNDFTVSTNKDKLRLNDATIGEYIFSVEGGKDMYGIFIIIIKCESLNEISDGGKNEIKDKRYMIGIYSIVAILSFSLAVCVICTCKKSFYCKKKSKKRHKNGHVRVKSHVNENDMKETIGNCLSAGAMGTPVGTLEIIHCEDDDLIYNV